jgi:hypothetical protein
MLGGALAAAVLIALGADDKNPAFTDAEKAGPDFAVQGEYTGETGKKDKIGVQVIARGDGKFVAELLKGGLPGDGWDGKTKLQANGTTEGKKITLTGKEWSGTIEDGKLNGTIKAGDDFTIKHVIRESKTQGAKPPEGATILFNGKDLEGWTKRDGKSPATWKLLDGGVMQVQGGDIQATKMTDKPFKMHVEFRLPFMPKSGGQGRANSGVYVQARYEVQVLDSFGLKGLDNECGGIYQQAAPLVNMCYPPLSWQTYDIEFTPAKFDGDKKTEDAVLTVLQNGVLVQDKLKLKKETPGGIKEDGKASPVVYLQDHGNPMQFRNIWVEMK